jgi:hypothetical protein
VNTISRPVGENAHPKSSAGPPARRRRLEPSAAIE